MRTKFEHQTATKQNQNTVFSNLLLLLLLSFLRFFFRCCYCFVLTTLHFGHITTRWYSLWCTTIYLTQTVKITHFFACWFSVAVCFSLIFSLPVAYFWFEWIFMAGKKIIWYHMYTEKQAQFNLRYNSISLMFTIYSLETFELNAFTCDSLDY